MIAHPPALSDTQLYAIDQFVLRGGRALVFVDPNSEIAQAAAAAIGQSGGPPRIRSAASCSRPGASLTTPAR